MEDIMKKRILASLLVATMVFGLTACGSAAPAETTEETAAVGDRDRSSC